MQKSPTLPVCQRISREYKAPFAFTGKLGKSTVDLK
jgi:hypothetical protein